MIEQELTTMRIADSRMARITLELLETTCAVNKFEFSLLLLIKALEAIQKLVPCTDQEFVDAVGDTVKRHGVPA